MLWLDHIIDKLAYKHNVVPYEVEEAIYNNPKIRFVARGKREGENIYAALGQSDSGRYLAVIFIYKENEKALIISARDMDDKERKQYGRK